MLLRPIRVALGIAEMGACVGVLLGAGCGSSRQANVGPLDARFVAVHNALSAMGLSQIGPIQQGSLRAGNEARSLWALPAGCVAIVALGGEGLGDLDATLLDARGKAVAHDTTTDSEAVVRPCLETEDTYVLVVKATSGQGSWVAAAWEGGLGAGGPASVPRTPVLPEANGTCGAPIPLAAGAVSGSTTHGEHENVGSCGPSDSRELVYELDVAERERVTIEVEARFDSVLYVRKDDCNDGDAEVACSDDAPDRTHSRVERVLDPGRYFVFVDGYGEQSGTFKMTVTAKDVLALEDLCRLAPALAVGTRESATTVGMADDAEATCGGAAEGAEAAWRLDLGSRSRVRIVEHSDHIAPVVYVRRVCADAQSEMACAESGAAPGDATITATFGAGAYTVFADAHDRDMEGRYTLGLETAPPSGTAMAVGACSDPERLAAGPAGHADGDTFAARDDVAGSCGGAGAADVVYRLDVARRSRLVAWLEHEEAPHLLIARRRCPDPSTEIACGPSLREVLASGTYFVAVDGASADAFGRFSLRWALRDLTDQDRECALAPTLVQGRPTAGSTLGTGDAFDTSCAENGVAATGPDRVFKIVLAERATVRIAVAAAGFDAEVELRMACADPVGGRLPELACQRNVAGTPLEHALEPGAYWVVVDGRSPKDQGPFTIEYSVVR
jgi:hypothetical protein